MRRSSPFRADDLADLDERLYSRASAVVAMRDVFDGARGNGVIGVRHDVDNVIDPAVAMAEWEAERGYRSTYFILHTSPYWQDKDLLRRSVDRIAELGHEIGFHVNAISEAITSRRDPVEIVEEAVAELRSFGHPVSGVVAHGDPLCHQYGFVNDEMFLESARPLYGAADRTVAGIVPLRPVSRSRFGFDYDPNWLSRGDYLSDSGGTWSQPFDKVANRFPGPGQLHMLVHADWWGEAFVGVAA